MLMQAPGTRGQSMIEYAVLIAAVTLGVAMAADLAYKAFLGKAQQIEREVTVF